MNSEKNLPTPEKVIFSPEETTGPAAKKPAKESFFTPARFWKREIWIFVVGLICGAGLLLLAAGLYLRTHLVREYVSELAFDEAAAALPAKIHKHMPEWTVSREACTLPALPDGKRMTVYKLCNKKYANQLLGDSSDRRAAAALPCTFVLFERPDGKAGLVRFDVRLLGYVLGGTPSLVFPGAVAPDQERLLKALYFQPK